MIKKRFLQLSYSSETRKSTKNMKTLSMNESRNAIPLTRSKFVKAKKQCRNNNNSNGNLNVVFFIFVSIQGQTRIFRFHFSYRNRQWFLQYDSIIEIQKFCQVYKRTAMKLARNLLKKLCHNKTVKRCKNKAS